MSNMPQMAPMNWFLLFLWFTFLWMIILPKIYFQ